MPVDWTPHRFTGGALALDVANTVVLRGDPMYEFDRLGDVAELPRFAGAASRFREAELRGRTLETDVRPETLGRIMELRESIDRLFRESRLSNRLRADRLARFLKVCAKSIGPGSDLDTYGRIEAGSGAIRLDAATALSGLSILPKSSRVQICANCGWLFLDSSRNGSRVWCDMAVCGNRRKAARHYRKVRRQLV
jgi:predicted RNA-binding Zn ribbon-like protein